MSPFMESDEAKDSKIKEQFPPGFDYDPNLPMNLQYQLLAYKNEQKRQEKARQLDKPPSKHAMHQSPSSSSQQQQLPPQPPPQHHHGEPQRQRSNEHLPVPPHMMSASPHRSSSRQTPPPRVPTPTAGMMSKSHGRNHPAGSSGGSSSSGGNSGGSRSFPSQHHNGGPGASSIIQQVGGGAATHNIVKMEPGGDDRHKMLHTPQQRGSGTKSPILNQKLQSGSQKQPPHPSQQQGSSSSSSSSSRKSQPSGMKHPTEPSPIHVKNEPEHMAWSQQLIPGAIAASSAGNQFMLVPTHMPWMAVAPVGSDHESIKSSSVASSSPSMRQRERESGGEGAEIVSAHSHGGAGPHLPFSHYSPSPRSTARGELSSSSEHKSSFSPVIGSHTHSHSSSRPPTSSPSHSSHS
ncbi:MAG: hypothetical protein MJE68_22970, partial [Proteobacteria bacterium]|nr:hypothetical protein [Pseudomonadota bacterium]